MIPLSDREKEGKFDPTTLEPLWWMSDEERAEHDEKKKLQAIHELELALAWLERASAHLCIDQPRHMADWDDDTREANHILLLAWAQVSREYRRLG